MSMNDSAKPRWLVAAVFFVVLWRIVAHLHPHPASSDPPGVRTAMAIMGLWFLAWGAWSLNRSGLPVRLFGLYCLTAGIHWGGPIGFGSERPDAVLLAFYVVITCASASLFLHLALSYPPPFGPSLRGWFRAILYAPAALGAIGLPLAAFSGVSLEVPLGLMLASALLFDLAGLAVWLSRPLVTSGKDRQRVLVVIAALLIGSISQAGSLMGLIPGEGWLNLAFAAVPPAIAFSLPERSRARET